MNQRSDNAQGALLMVGSQVAFTVNDTMLKGLSGEVPFFQAMFVRGLGVAILMAAMCWWMGLLRFNIAREDRLRVVIRTLAEAAAAFFFVSALFNMPIANATAILQVLPLAVALGAWLVLGEPLGWRRFAAIAVGFVGVLLVVRPGFEGFTVWSLYALAAVLSVTVRDLATRRMTSTLPSLTVAFAGSLGVLAFAAVGAWFVDWQPMSIGSASLMAGAIVSLIVAYLLSVAVMRVGDIAVIAPFRYTSLVAALIFGLVFFDEWPDALTLLGSVIIVASGLYTLWRERAVRKVR